MLELFAKNFKFSRFGFSKISPEIKNKRVFIEKISLKKNKDLLIKDKKDAGALKVKKEDLQKNYTLYADLLLRSGYIKIAEELVENKEKILYNIITESCRFNIENTTFLDYNSNMDSFLEKETLV